MWKKIANVAIVIVLVVGMIISIYAGWNAYESRIFVFAHNAIIVIFAACTLGLLSEILENIETIAVHYKIHSAEEKENTFIGTEPVGKDMWTCSKCGNLNSSGAVYCGSCGADKEK